MLGGFYLLASAKVASAEVVTLLALQEAANSGNCVAQRELGNAYYIGRQVQQNYDKAYYWLLKAAIKGDPIAEALLGRAYEAGNGVAKDETKAFDWYVRAADQGDDFSECRVGNFYIEGRVIPTDPAKGFAYLLHAAAKDFAPAQLDVATCYAKGIYVRPDPILAYKWAFLASIRLPQAAAALPDYRKNLSRDQLDQGQRDAEDWVRRGKYGLPQHELTWEFVNGVRTKFLFASANGDICIPVLLQSKEAVYLIVDTGSARTIIDSDVAGRLGLKGNDYDAFGAFGKNLATGATATNVQLGLPGLTLSHARVVTCSISDAVGVFTNPRPFGDTPLGGLIGSDLLSQFVVHIDYANSYIEFIAPKYFQPDPAADVLPLGLLTQAPTISATIRNGAQQSVPGAFLVDSGNGGALSLSHTFTEKNPDLRLQIATYSGVFGLGGPSPAPVGKCSSLNVGKTSIAKPVFVLTQPLEESSMDGTIGNDIWHRFDVTIDFPGKKIYLKPNADLNQPFTCNLYGLIIKELGKIPPSCIVSKVWDDSVAAAGGIKEGDVVEKVNGMDPSLISLQQLQSILNHEGVIQLSIARSNFSQLVTLKSATLPGPD